jgi:hypothetical protein
MGFMKKFVFTLILVIFTLNSCSFLDSYELTGQEDKTEYSYSNEGYTYIVNKSTLTYHKGSCYMAKRIDKNCRWETCDIELLDERGYKRCNACFD